MLLKISEHALIHSDSSRVQAVISNELIKELNGVQMLTIYLMKLKLDDGEYSDFELLYLDSLPADFKFHPLEWPQEYIDKVPNHTRKLIDDVRKRYENDLTVFKNAYDKYRRQFRYDYDDYYNVFKWSWLIVNTRSLYYPVKGKEDKVSQLSLCPYLDLINHGSPTPNSQNLFTSLPKPYIPHEGGYELINTTNNTIPSSKIVNFMYGAHNDAFLLSEYGFTLGCELNAFSSINITDEIYDMINISDKKLSLMETYNLNRDFNLDLYPSPCHPSINLIFLLKLLAIKDDDQKGLRDWIKLINFELDIINDENEFKAKEVLMEICHKLKKKVLTNLNDDVVNKEPNIKKLYMNDSKVLNAIIENIENDIDIL